MKKAEGAKDVKKTKKGVPVGYGRGHRKTAIARVWLRKGSGNLHVNGKDYKDYFDTEVSRLDVTTLFRIIPISSNYDIEANVGGGGQGAQAGAVRLGMARALVEIDNEIRSLLRKHDLLTVDSRQKERKKYGQRGARRKFQFVKR